MFYLGRKFATEGTGAGADRWESLWQYPSFRRAHRVTTAVWGAGFLIEAAAKAVCAWVLPFDTAYVVNQVAPVALTIPLMTWTFMYGARTRRAGERARLAAAE